MQKPRGTPAETVENTWRNIRKHKQEQRGRQAETYGNKVSKVSEVSKVTMGKQGKHGQATRTRLNLSEQALILAG